MPRPFKAAMRSESSACSCLAMARPSITFGSMAFNRPVLLAGCENFAIRGWARVCHQREAYGVRGACSRSRQVHVAPKRQQAGRTPYASRGLVAVLPRLIVIPPAARDLRESVLPQLPD